MDYQGNTRKEREKKELPEKKVERVVIGEVVQKPKTITRKFKDTFFGGNARQAVMFVTADVLLPALRNLIVDMTSKGIERVVYGETGSRRRLPPTRYDTRYDTRYQLGNPLIYRSEPRIANLPDQPRIRQNRHEMNDLILPSKEEAELVVERLIDILDTYQVVSLADLNVLIGLETSHIDNKWGWTYLGNVQIRQVRQGYLLELPPLEEI